jgi:hypothetical protein
MLSFSVLGELPVTIQENAPTPEEPAVSAPTPPKKRRWFRKEKVGPAFWTIASLFSMIVNVILIIVLISLGTQLFTLKSLVQDQLLGGLYTNFQLMDQAHIRTTIPVNAEVPAKFDLPLSTNTIVTLTADTTIAGATIYELEAWPLYISKAKTNIILPAGTELPVALNLVVPVDQTIPVNLVVNVDIPLEQTELHPPFVGLQEVVKPYYTLLEDLPDSWKVTVCGVDPQGLCAQYVP